MGEHEELCNRIWAIPAERFKNQSRENTSYTNNINTIKPLKRWGEEKG